VPDAVDENPESVGELLVRVGVQRRRAGLEVHLVPGAGRGLRPVELAVRGELDSGLFPHGLAKHVVDEPEGQPDGLLERESSRDEQLGRRASHPQGAGDGARAGGFCDQPRSVPVREQRLAQLGGQHREPLIPAVAAGRAGAGHTGHQPFCHGINEGLLVLEMPVKGAGLNVKRGGEPAHRERVEALGLEQRERSGQHVFPAELCHGDPSSAVSLTPLGILPNLNAVQLERCSY